MLWFISSPQDTIAQQSTSSATNASTLDNRVRELAPKSRRPAAAEIELPEASPVAPATAETAISVVLAAVVIEGATVFTESTFGPDYEEFLAQQVGIDEISTILQRITERYRAAGYSLSRAIAPPQDIGSGILTVKIIEGYLESVRFTGDVKDASSFEGYARRLKAHRPLTQSTLERYTLAIADISGYSVEPILKAVDEDAGKYALELGLTHKPVDGVALVNNRGTPEVGRIQTWLSGGMNSVLGIRERLQVGFFTIPNEPEESLYGELSYIQPIGFEGTMVSAAGALSVSEAGSSDAAANTESKFERFTISAWHPFIRSREENLWLRGVFEFRNFHENTFARTSTNDRLRVMKGRLGYWRQGLFDGTLSLSLELTKGLDVLGESTTGSNDLSRFDGESDFAKAVFDIVRDQHLTGGFWVQLSAMGQWSPDRLLSSEEFSIGGSRFGRGYDFSEITGDEGIALSIEPRHWWNIEAPWISGVAAYGFYDWGVVWNDIRDTGITKDTVASAGGGLRMFFPLGIRADLEFALPLTRPVETTDDNDVRVFFELTKNY